MSGTPYIFPGGAIGYNGTLPTLGATNPNFPTDADHVALIAEYAGLSLYVTSTVNLTATRTLTLPLTQGYIGTVFNATQNGQSINVGGASGAVVTINNGSFAFIGCPDGANFYALSGGAGTALVLTPKTTSFTAQAGFGYKLDTTGGVLTATLPSAPTEGQLCEFLDAGIDCGTNAATIAAAGAGIQIMNVNGALGSTVSMNRNGIHWVFEYIVNTPRSLKYWHML